MARGSGIIVTSDPKGQFVQVIIGAALTPKPGTVLQYDPTVALSNGLFTAKLFNGGANGNRTKGPLLVLLDDHDQGKLITDAYAAGNLAKCYIPIHGDEINMLLKDVAGTADSHTAGEMEMIEDTSGKLIATTGTPQSTPFMLLETLPALTADTLAWCTYGG